MYQRLIAHICRPRRSAIQHSFVGQPFTTTQHLHLNKRPTAAADEPAASFATEAPQPLRQLLAAEADRILYSSYVDSLTPGWRESAKQQRRQQRQRTAEAQDAVRVRPFSAALQFMQAEADGESTKAPTEADRSGRDDNDDVTDRIASTSSSSSSSDTTTRTAAWMHDYESYQDPTADDQQDQDDDDGDSAATAAGLYGTADPSQPVSDIPCHGCGAQLQCAEPSLPGYLPSEIFVGQRKEYLKSITCQRCHFLRHYNTVLDVTVPPSEYVRLISSIQDRFALALLLVDLTDMPGSLWPNIASIVGQRRPLIIVGNKVDLLPRDSAGHLEHVRGALERTVAEQGISAANIKHTCLISAHTGFGVEELITKLHNVWQYRGDVYLLGCTNAGKSTLFNALLRSDYCKAQAAQLIGRATASPWPGTTMRMLKFPIMRPNDWRMYVRTKRIMSQRGQRAAEERLRRDQAQQQRHNVQAATLIGHIDRTFREEGLPTEVSDSFGMGATKTGQAPQLNEHEKQYRTSKWCFDTPGVVQPEQTLNLLTTAELLRAIPRRMIVPRTYRMAAGWTLFVGGLGRLDYVKVDQDGDGVEADEEQEGWIRVTVYASDRLPVLIVRTTDAERLYERFLGTDVLAVPAVDLANEQAAAAERLARWPALEGKRMEVEGVLEGEEINVKSPKKRRPAAATSSASTAAPASCDIILSSAGWVAVHAEPAQRLHFHAWTPEGRGIARRTPALVPFGQRLCGARIRGSLAHQNRRAFV